MKTQILIVCMFLVFKNIAIGQKSDLTGNLCQGYYFTPEQGKAFLDQRSLNLGSQEQWQKRADSIKMLIIEGSEISKIPSHKLKIIKTKKYKFKDYTVENLAIETLPGVYLTGNLYRPVKSKSKNPGILYPHGHFREPYARFSEDSQKGCATLAKMGAVVFIYDMIGYGDNMQCNHKIPKALKLQLWNNLKALDYLTSLPEVDTTRIGITGASGGGTQTILTTAIDARIKVSVPVVMVSSHFFGGCVCESGMPIHKSTAIQTNNVEIAALAAPRPMLLVSDGTDWTQYNPNVEFPFLQKVYQLYGKTPFVENQHLPLEKHDFGPSKRKTMYIFFIKHLKLNQANIVGDFDLYEKNMEILSEEKLMVFTKSNPLPKNALHGDDQIMELLNR
ncbi:MAG: alpha/beta hydrolase family protein [Leadbetterella sp.]